MFVKARLPALFILALLAILFALAISPAPTLAAAQGGNTAIAPALANYGCAYIVQDGDDLFRISLRFGIPMYTMMWNNGLYSPNFVYAGMRLNVPCMSPYSSFYGYRPPVAYNNSYGNYGYNNSGYGNNGYGNSGYSNSGYGRICAIHIVAFGEDLFRIALRYGMTWPTLAAANHLFNPNLIFAGMRLAIPCTARSNAYGSNPYSSAPAANPYGMPSMNPAPAPAPNPGQGTNVTIQDFSFAPANITIHAGQTVTWQNNGPSMHTVTSNTGAFDSGALNPGATYSHTFSTTGTFAYHCAIHPMMMGTVTVVP